MGCMQRLRSQLLTGTCPQCNHIQALPPLHLSARWGIQQRSLSLPKGHLGTTRALKQSSCHVARAKSRGRLRTFRSWKLSQLSTKESKKSTSISSVKQEQRQGVGEDEEQALASWVAPLGLVTGIALLVGGGILFKEDIRHFLDVFIREIDDWGSLGYVAFVLVYIGLEVLAVPAIPLTVTGGLIFGPIIGTLLVSLSSTSAATIAFLISRYAARDKVLQWAQGNPKFAAIDRAIGRDGLKIVTLLRLSPLLPFAISNYLYGLTSVDLGPYVLGSCIGMLPGTYAYVTAGHLGKNVLLHGEGGLPLSSWQVALAIGVTLLTLGIVGQTAKRALEDVDVSE